MQIHLLYYRSVHFLFLVITMLVFPALATYLLFFYEAQTPIQFLSVEKILMFYLLFVGSTILSGRLYALRKEKAPTKWNQLLFIALLSTLIILPSMAGYSLTKGYAAIIQDDMPVQLKGPLTHLTGYHEKYFGPFDYSRYGQFPSDSKGKPNRYAIEFKVDQQTFHTAYFFHETEYMQILTRLQELENQPIIVTYLPDTKQIVRIEENQTLPGIPIFENPILLSNTQ